MVYSKNVVNITFNQYMTLFNKISKIIYCHNVGNERALYRTEDSTQVWSPIYKDLYGEHCKLTDVYRFGLEPHDSRFFSVTIPYIFVVGFVDIGDDNLPTDMVRTFEGPFIDDIKTIIIPIDNKIYSSRNVEIQIKSVLDMLNSLTFAISNTVPNSITEINKILANLLFEGTTEDRKLRKVTIDILDTCISSDAYLQICNMETAKNLIYDYLDELNWNNISPRM